MDRRFYQRNHYSNLDQLCNHFHCYSRNNRGLNYLLRSIFVLLIHSLNHLQLLLHSLKPNSSTHPLQIYCIGLTGLEFIYPLGIVHKPSPYRYIYLIALGWLFVINLSFFFSQKFLSRDPFYFFLTN